MQPKRDPTDPRFISARLGGLGGFSYYRKQGKPAPYRYGALSDRASLSHNPRPTRVTPDGIDRSTSTMDIETVRARARLLSVKVLDELDARASSMDVDQLTDTLNAAGKLSGAGNTQGSVNVNVGALHLAALKERAQLATPQRTQLVDASQVTASHVTSPITVDATIYTDTGNEGAEG